MRISAIAIGVALIAASPAARGEVGGAGRPRGFALELEMTGSSYVPLTGLGAGVSLWGPWGFAPRLFLGGQLGRFSIGGQVGMGVSHIAQDDGPDDTYWTISVGPKFDYEVWALGPGGLYIAAAVPFEVAGNDDDWVAPGFGLDFGLGGRVIVGRWLLASVLAGTRLDVAFVDFDDRDTRDEVQVGWALYGSLALRYVAAR